MSNLESNPPREVQEEQARQSPVKRPETETSDLSPSEVAHADQPGNKNRSGQPDAQGDTDRPYGHETEHPDGVSSEIEDVTPRSVDTANDDLSDDTVDTDGKARDAMLRRPGEDQYVSSNATLENAVPTPAVGLAGIDSRPGGNVPAILPREGSEVRYEGVVEDDAAYPAAGGDRVLPADLDPVPRNESRTAHRVSIVPHDNEK